LICGNGRIQNANSEACDDGNTTPGDGCSALCVVEIGWTCAGVEPGISTC
jgi:cysteine-rich repeat protein